MRKSKAIAPLLALALVAAACGGDDDDDDAGGTTDAPAEETSAPTADTQAPGPDTTTPSDDTEPTTEATSAPTTEGAAPTTSADDGDDVEPCTDNCEPIVVGMLADQSGAFAPLVTEVVAAQQVFWDDVNANGGIYGHPVELRIEDNRYDVATHQEKYNLLREEVDIFSQSTGSPHTAAIAQQLVDDDLLAIPLTWYSGWAFDEANGQAYGQNVYETYTNYCFESMNAIEWLNENRDVNSVAIISFPGEYGQDGAAGAKIAAEALGLDVVYDGEGLVTPPTADNPSPDQSAVISGIVSSGADLVWATINPATLGAIMANASGQGYAGMWSGNSPTYSFKMLATPLAPLLDSSYIVSTYISTWGADVSGMTELVDKMTAARPDITVSDVYILGWTEAMVTKAILEKAFENDGEITREGILEAAQEVTVDFQGLAPEQSWSGEPNDFAVRESYIYDVSLEDYNFVTLGEGGGSTGMVALEGPFVSDTAAAYDFSAPCFVSG